MELRRQRHARIFQERIQRKNVLDMFGDEHLIKWLHFLKCYSKRAKNITKEHHNGLQFSTHIMRSTPYDE